jgi:hypothetical protein
MKLAISRRSLMKTFAGLSAGATAHFGGLFRDAFAQTAPPLRLIVLSQMHGITPLWSPRTTAGAAAADQSTGWTLDFDPDSCLGPLEPYKQSMVIADGLDFYCCYKPGASGAEGHHSAVAALTGSDLRSDSDRRPFSASLDTALGSFLKVQPFIFTFSELNAASGVKSWDATGNIVGGYGDVVQAYNQLFSGAPSNSGMPDRAAQARLQAQKSVLGYLKGEADVLRPRLASTEQVKLDMHLDALSLMEQKLMAPPVMTVSCSKPTAPPSTRDDQIDPPTRHQLVLEYVAMLMACNTTRVATVHMEPGNSMPYLDLGSGTPNVHQDIVHNMVVTDDLSVRRVSRVHRWHSTQVARLCSLLKAMPEGSGTVYDNTIILWTNELGNGAGHTPWNVPFVLLGGGGSWAKYRYLNFGTGTTTPHNRLLVSVLNQFGMNLQSFGDSTVTGGLAGL